MRRRWRHSKDRTAARRARVTRLFVRPLLLCLVPGMLAGLVVAWLIEVPLNARLKLDGWQFIALIAPATFVCGFAVSMVGFGLYLRRLLRYHTRRRGREHALSEFLRPSDLTPGTWRRLEFAVYGITGDDLRAFREARRSGDDAT